MAVNSPEGDGHLRVNLASAAQFQYFNEFFYRRPKTGSKRFPIFNIQKLRRFPTWDSLFQEDSKLPFHGHGRLLCVPGSSSTAIPRFVHRPVDLGALFHAVLLSGERISSRFHIVPMTCKILGIGIPSMFRWRQSPPNVLSF
jgi:hypothetical protein